MFSDMRPFLIVRSFNFEKILFKSNWRVHNKKPTCKNQLQSYTLISNPKQSFMSFSTLPILYGLSNDNLSTSACIFFYCCWCYSLSTEPLGLLENKYLCLCRLLNGLSVLLSSRRIYRDGELICFNWFTANPPTKKCPQLQKAR